MLINKLRSRDKTYLFFFFFGLKLIQSSVMPYYFVKHFLKDVQESFLQFQLNITTRNQFKIKLSSDIFEG